VNDSLVSKRGDALNERMATLFVFSSGDIADRVTRIAEEHASFAPDNRRVVRVKDTAWIRGVAMTQPATAIVLNARNEVIALLDTQHALSEPWIEDAFLRGARAFEESAVAI
jgi:hypothetical protein